MRGQNSRSGGGVRPGFEGGQTPLYRRIPKFVGRPQKGHEKTEYELVSIDLLNRFTENEAVDTWALPEQGHMTKPNKSRKLYKVVGGSEFTVPNLTVRAHAFTSSAKAAIEGLGGACIVMSPTLPIPLAEALVQKAALKASLLVKLKERRKLKAKTAALKNM